MSVVLGGKMYQPTKKRREYYLDDWTKKIAEHERRMLTEIVRALRQQDVSDGSETTKMA